MTDLLIRALSHADAPALSRLLASDPPEYRRYFQPFATDGANLASMLDSVRRDRFWGIVAGGELAALVMLRGFDQGFAVPAFGVYVARARSRQGLATLALAFAQAWCRANGCAEIMLTVHPDNAAARDAYERDGFAFDGQLSAVGHRIYRKRLTR